MLRKLTVFNILFLFLFIFGIAKVSQAYVDSDNQFSGSLKIFFGDNYKDDPNSMSVLYYILMYDKNGNLVDYSIDNYEGLIDTTNYPVANIKDTLSSKYVKIISNTTSNDDAWIKITPVAPVSKIKVYVNYNLYPQYISVQTLNGQEIQRFNFQIDAPTTNILKEANLSKYYWDIVNWNNTENNGDTARWIADLECKTVDTDTVVDNTSCSLSYKPDTDITVSYEKDYNERYLYPENTSLGWLFDMSGSGGQNDTMASCNGLNSTVIYKNFDYPEPVKLDTVNLTSFKKYATNDSAQTYFRGFIEGYIDGEWKRITNTVSVNVSDSSVKSVTAPVFEEYRNKLIKSFRVGFDCWTTLSLTRYVYLTDVQPYGVENCNYYETESSRCVNVDDYKTVDSSFCSVLDSPSSNEYIACSPDRYGYDTKLTFEIGGYLTSNNVPLGIVREIQTLYGNDIISYTVSNVVGSITNTNYLNDNSPNYANVSGTNVYGASGVNINNSDMVSSYDGLINGKVNRVLVQVSSLNTSTKAYPKYIAVKDKDGNELGRYTFTGTEDPNTPIEIIIVPYDWKIGDWTPVLNNESCGMVTQTRTVECIDMKSNVIVEDSFCNNSLKPNDTQVVDAGACPEWVIGDWTPEIDPNACGVITQTRNVDCIDRYGDKVDDSRCADTRPIDTQDIDTGYECKSFTFFVGPKHQDNNGDGNVLTELKFYYDNYEIPYTITPLNVDSYFDPNIWTLDNLKDNDLTYGQNSSTLFSYSVNNINSFKVDVQGRVNHAKLTYGSPDNRNPEYVYFTDNESNELNGYNFLGDETSLNTVTFGFVDPTPFVTFSGDTDYMVSDSSLTVDITGTVNVNTDDPYAVVKTEYKFLDNNSNIIKSGSFTDKNYTLTENIPYGNYKLEVVSSVNNRYFDSKDFDITVNIPKPTLLDSAIVCDTYKTYSNDTVDCYINTDNVQMFGTMYVEWYQDGVLVGNGNNITLTMPNATKNVYIEAKIAPQEQVTQSTSDNTVIKVISPIINYSVIEYDDYFQKGDIDNITYYPMRDTGKIRITPAFSTSDATANVEVYYNDNLIETVTDFGISNKYELSLDSILSSMNVYDRGVIRFVNKIVDFPDFQSEYEVGIIKSPARLGLPTITEYQKEPIDKQYFKVDVKKYNGEAYNQATDGSLILKFIGSIGGENAEYTFNYVDNNTTYEVDLNTKGSSSMYPVIAYTDPFFTRTYSGANVSFNSYITYPVEATLTNFNPIEAFLPYTTSIKLNLAQETADGFGYVEWQASTDNGNTWTTILDNSTSYYLTQDLKTAGDYLIRAVTHHRILDSVTYMTEPVKITILDIPMDINNIPFRIIRYGIDDLQFTTRLEDGIDSIQTLTLLTQPKTEYFTGEDSYWEVYDADTNEILYQIPFRTSVRNNLPDTVGKNILVKFRYKTNLDRYVRGEMQYYVNNENLIQYAIPEISTRLNYFDFTIMCSKYNSCFDNIKDKLYEGEIVKNAEWHLYKVIDGVQTELSLENSRPSLSGFTYKDSYGGDFIVTATMTTSLGRTVEARKEFNIDWISQLDPAKTEPITFTIRNNTTANYQPVNLNMSIILDNSMRLSDLSKIEWYVDGSKVSEEMRLNYTLEDAGQHTVYAISYNKYFEDGNTFTSDPITIEVLPTPEDKTADLEVNPITLTKYRYVVTLPQLLSGEKLVEGNFTITDSSNNELYSNNSYVTSSYILFSSPLNELTHDDNVTAKGIYRTNYGRTIIAEVVIPATLPQTLSGLEPKIYYTQETRPLTFKCDFSNGCITTDLRNQLLSGESIESSEWQITRDGQNINNGELYTYYYVTPEAPAGTYNINVTLNTTMGRQLVGSAEYTIDYGSSSSGTTNTTTDLDTALRYFNPTESLYTVNVTTMNYSIVVGGVGYLQLKGYGYTVKLLVDGQEFDNPTRFDITFSSAGEKDFVYQLIDSQNNVVHTVTNKVNILTPEMIFSSFMPNVVVTAKNVDSNTNTVRIEATEIGEPLRKLFNDPNVYNSDGFSYGIKIEDIDTNVVEDKFVVNNTMTFITLGTTTEGSFKAYFVVNYNGVEYKSPIETIDVANIIANIEIFDVDIQMPLNIYWGTVYIYLTPLIPAQQNKYTYWQTTILDPQGNVVKVDRRQTRTYFTAEAPGLYKAKIEVFSDANYTNKFYEKIVDVNVVNELPILDSLDAKLVRTRLGDLFFAGKASAHDVDSRQVWIDWSLCDGQFTKERYNMFYVIIGEELSDCQGESFILINDGIGEPVKHIINIQDLPIE